VGVVLTSTVAIILIMPSCHNNHWRYTIDHFYEKLLLLRGMMKTKAGQRKAEGRHQAMMTFLARFHDECTGVL
jgi:uncharacterized protein